MKNSEDDQLGTDRDETLRTPITRKSFLRRTAGGVLLAAPAIGALVNAAPAMATYHPCEDSSKIRCELMDYVCKGGTDYAVYHCFDTVTGDYCYSYDEPVACC